MSGEESYVRARWAAAAADAAELRQQLDAAGRTEVLLRARVADLEAEVGQMTKDLEVLRKAWVQCHGHTTLCCCVRCEAASEVLKRRRLPSSGANQGERGGQ